MAGTPPAPFVPLVASFVLALAAPAHATPPTTTHPHPGCTSLPAQACLAQAIEAMGGRARLQSVREVELQGMGHTLLMEQSYRQAPFLASYQRFHEWLDFDDGRVRSEQTITWPQAGGTSPTEVASTQVMTPSGGDYRAGGRSLPLPASARAASEERLQLDPLRLLLTAAAAQDLQAAPPVSLHGTPHDVLTFVYHGRPLALLLDPVSHLPDAVERTRTFDDFWYAWGDVRERIYFDNWILVDGISYPTTRIEERNGAVWRSTQALSVHFNGTEDPARFTTEHALAADAAAAPSRWERPFDPQGHVEVAPGVDFYPGAWNTAVIRQDDGVVVLETPISPVYTRGLLAQAHARYPGLPIKAVLTSSDAWPHAAGVREAVAGGLPVYALDLNLPLLRRLLDAPHALHPDSLQDHPRTPVWRVVSGRTVIGRGDNRIELYPLRGADTGRQYMVYFPARQLLYASDTLVLDPKSGELYQPELMHEVMQAVAREHLAVRTVFAMHQGPTPWSQVVQKVEAARRGP
ncbi:hypothetical protein ACFWZU_10200 [Frateuria sp. GZRR33]|uniref:hypothetical protein n=1 Tax=Frateuria sp. GZRR33 TaxID=3351535 RepID=UPI003EDC9DB7